MVVGIDVHYEINHTCRSDLEVDLTNENLDREIDLWSEEGTCGPDITETEYCLTGCNGEPVNQTWRLWAADWWNLDTGYIDYWWIKVYYEPETCTSPANDSCFNARTARENTPSLGSTNCATGSYESGCSYNDTADVWHSYTPDQDDNITISLAGSAFDTTLSVFDGCGGEELVCNDDAHNTLQSEINMKVWAGNTYFIRIAGYDGETGNYTLNISRLDCDLPAPPIPDSPSPADEANEVAVDVTLSWNGDDFEHATNQLSNLQNTVTTKVIYGEDDRREEYEILDDALLAAGDSTVAIMTQSDLTDNGDGTFSLSSQTYAEWYLDKDPIVTGNPLCEDEPFRDQPNPAFHSGFLVGPDIIATAGHYAGGNLDSIVVFGFTMLDDSNAASIIDSSEIYYCTELIEQTETADWALIRLDREVVGHNYLPVRAGGTVADQQSLIVIGHPLGLPRKYADGATVRQNDPLSPYFEANLDTYAGNAGSAVFNADTLEVEGILVQGNPDWQTGLTCDRSMVCSDSAGCDGDWEVVTRATEFSALLTSYDVYLGVDPFNLQLIESGTTVPGCDPGLLEPGTTYYWKVIAKRCDHVVSGPTWSFTMFTTDPHSVTCWDPQECPGQQYGDADCDGDVGTADLDALKSRFGKNAPWATSGCCADFNHDGKVNLADLCILKMNISSSGYLPSARNQQCPR